MQRDMDLVRQLLLAVEASPDPALKNIPTIDGWSEQQIIYHLKLLSKGKLLEVSLQNIYDGGAYFSHITLTWEGHDFLDAARDEKVWQKTTNTIGEKVRSVSFEVLKDLLVVTARSMLGM